MAEKKSTKADRKMYGVTVAPTPATRVLVGEMEHDFGVPANKLIIIDDNAKTFRAANVYGGNLGRNHDAADESQIHPLPAEGDDKWKKWTKDGYVDGDVAKFPCLKQVAVKAAKQAPATAGA